jgi:choline dehydrogenase-like flavoprotein
LREAGQLASSVFQGTVRPYVTILNSRQSLNTLGLIRQIHARQLVVLSAGTIGTPMILERSGVGDGSHLKSIGVKKIISVIPGVVASFNDHYICVGPIARIRAGEDETMDRNSTDGSGDNCAALKGFRKGTSGINEQFHRRWIEMEAI